MTIANTLEALQKEFDEKFKENHNGRNSVGVLYIDAPESKIKSFLHSSNLRVLEAVDEFLESKKIDLGYGNRPFCPTAEDGIKMKCNETISAIQEELRKFTK